MKATTKKKTIKKGKANKPHRAAKTATSSSHGRRQVAALPYRKTVSGEIEILLITSRDTGRFIVPKGWPMKRLDDHDAAAREAYEEAGVSGKVGRKPIGEYSYWKRLDRSFELLKVAVYPLEVQKRREDWPEKNTRRSGWLPLKDAAALVDEPELITLLKSFRP